jgi:hypothetical protein
MRLHIRIAIALTVLLSLATIAGAQTWTALNHQPPFPAGPMLQLRDGRILVHEDQGGNAQNWWVLTPSPTGSYVNGTWSSAGSMQAGYAPFFFGSQVLTDGKTVVIEGGEYNNGSAVWTTLGSRLTYSGNSFTWVSNAPPAGWSTIGDAQSVLLPDTKGSYMQANCCTKQNAIYTGPNTWATTGNVLAIRNDESGWTLLPNDKVLAVDVQVNNNCGTGNLKSTELYDYVSGSWSCAAQTPVQLWTQSDQELGAAQMMYNGKVIQFGGNVSATAVYNVAANTWAPGPTPANGLQQADGPTALEPNGKVLAMLSPGLFQFGQCQYVEYDPATNSLANTANAATCPSGSSFIGHLFVLPTGQIMNTDFTNFVQVYNPVQGVPPGVAPTILAHSSPLPAGSVNNVLWGKQLNGLSQGSAYGDDYQGDTNFPLVRLTCVTPSVSGGCTIGNVYWAVTHDESTHSIKPGVIMFTKFDIPASTPNGNYNLNVVANGIMSNTLTASIP